MKSDLDFKEVTGLPDLFRNGEGYNKEEKYSKFKLCLTATKLDYLIEILSKVSLSKHCFRVKYRPKEKSGMYLGRIVMVDDEKTGELWCELRSDKNLLCSVQDDEFCRGFRDQEKIQKIRESIKEAMD